MPRHTTPNASTTIISVNRGSGFRKQRGSCSPLRRAGSERTVEVGHEVVDVLDANGDPDEVVSQTALLADGGGDGRVRHEARQADERLHAPCIWEPTRGRKRGQLKSFSRQVVKLRHRCKDRGRPDAHRS